MANLAKIFEDGDGYKLTLAQAKRLYKAKEIAAPTLIALKNYFLNEVVAPKLKKAGENLGANPSSRDVSNLRKAIPELLAFDVEGNEHKLISLNKLWTAIKASNKSGEPLANASSFFRDDYRTRAGTGFDENSLRLADVYDEIDNLRAIRDRDLVGADANKEDAVYSQYDRAMGQLFHKNRRWMPKKGNEPIKYSPIEDREGKYGWQEGMSREGFLQSQTGAYTLSEDQSRWLAKRLGIRQDAGHTVPLGGIVISDAERQEFFLAKSELEELPNNEWLLRGTNAITNLAIEDAKGNRAKGNSIGRQLKDIIQANVDFTKTRALTSYNLGKDKSFRKLSDFSTPIQTLFAHGDRDINELQAIGEDLILLRGVEEAQTLKKSQLKSQKGLVPAFQKKPTETIGGLTTTVLNEAGNVLSRRFDPNPPSLLNTKANTINDTIGSNSLDPAALQPTVKPKPSIVEIQKAKKLNQVWNPETGQFETKENNPNEFQEGIDLANTIAWQGFHASADYATGGTYNQVRNVYNASQNVLEGNYLGLGLNLLSVELTDTAPYLSPWGIQTDKLLPPK